MGIAIVGGLLVSQFLTLYTTPVIYLYLDRLGARMRRRGAMPLSPDYCETNLPALPAETHRR
jgi:hypothetical protein